MGKISLGLRNFRYGCEIFAILAKFLPCIPKILHSTIPPMLPPALLPHLILPSIIQFNFDISSPQLGGITKDSHIQHQYEAKLADVDPYPIHGPVRLAFKWKDNVKRKCGLIFEFWKIHPQGGTVLLWSRHLLFCCYFIKGKTK